MERNCVPGYPATITLSPDVSTLRAAALGYAARGWPVFPVWRPQPVAPSLPDELVCACPQNIQCASPGKHPIPPTGYRAATLWPTDIEVWWGKHPRNIGINLGVARLLVIDLDSREAVARWERSEFASIRTRTVSTARGRHVYFSQDPNDHPIHSVPQSKFSQAHEGWTKTEVKAAGGYVVAPPSRHVTGRIYEWINPAMPVAPMPPELRAWVLATGAVVGGPALGRRSAERRSGGLRPIYSVRDYTAAALRRLAHSDNGSRNNDACATALALADVAEMGGYPLELLREWFFSAAADCGLLDDELAKTHELWCRMTGDDFPVSEVAA